MAATDPFNPALTSPFDHSAFYESGAPYWGPAYDVDTGLRCFCGREVVADDDSPSGWSHVGIGDTNDPSGRLEWERAVRAA